MIKQPEPNHRGRVRRGQDPAAEGGRQEDHLHPPQQRRAAQEGRTGRCRRRVRHPQPGRV